MKKKLVIIGNCQCSGIIHYLYQNKEFSDTYEYKQYANWQLIENNCDIPSKEISSADLLIYQPLEKRHGIYSTDPSVKNSIGSFVGDKCVKIGFPFVYSDYIWPLIQKQKGSNRWFGSDSIDKLLESGLNLNDILNLHENRQIDWQYSSRYKHSMDILKNKEEKTDVKISSFIEKNLSEMLMFLIPEHPSSIIYWNMCNQILKILNMKELNQSVIISENHPFIPDSIYETPNGIIPLSQSSVDFYKIKNMGKYVNDNFYANRIMQYINSKV